jgi:hypothetical protein
MKKVVYCIMCLFLTYLIISCEDAAGVLGSYNLLPQNNASSLSFIDEDKQAGEISGDILIGKADDESDITHYNLYWGKYSFLPLGWPFAELEKSGSDLVYTLNSNTIIPAEINYIMVVTRNGSGEMNNGLSIEIIDTDLPSVVPINMAEGITFTDEDDGFREISGDILIEKAVDESDLTHYQIYWGSSINTTSGSPIAEISKTGSNIVYPLSINTQIPSGINYLLVYTKNEDGPMATGLNLEIYDHIIGDLTIYDIQNDTLPDHPLENVDVVLDEVIVTAVKSNDSFWVQESTGGEYSGLYIYNSGINIGSLSVGDEVSLRGEYKEYYGLSELVLEEITITNSGVGVPVPEVVLPADVETGGSMAENYEGVLVTVNNVTVLNENPEDPSDDNEFTVTDGLRVDDEIYLISPDPQNGDIFTSITGILTYTITQSAGSQYTKLLPRYAADVIKE